MIVATASPARTALKNSQLTRQPPGERHAYFGDSTLTHKDLPGVGFTFGEVSRFCLAGGGFSTEHDTAVSV